MGLGYLIVSLVSKVPLVIFCLVRNYIQQSPQLKIVYLKKMQFTIMQKLLIDLPVDKDKAVVSYSATLTKL